VLRVTHARGITGFSASYCAVDMPTIEEMYASVSFAELYVGRRRDVAARDPGTVCGDFPIASVSP
jgi:hypothetical protein